MTPTTLVWFGIVGLIALMFAGQIWAAVKRFIPASNTSTTIGKSVDTASRWAQYAAGRAAVYELRLVDFTNGSLDITAELNKIEEKMAAAVKLANLDPPPVQGQG